MYKCDRRKEVCRLFGRQKRMHIASEVPQLPPSFEFAFTLPPREELLTAKKLPPYCITAIFWFTASAKVVTAKNEKNAYRLKFSAVWQYRPRLCPPEKPLPMTTLDNSNNRVQSYRRIKINSIHWLEHVGYHSS